MYKRKCEFCQDWTPEYLQEYYDVTEMICGCCHGTTDCFCHAYKASECSCNADWSDDILEDWGIGSE